MTWGYTNGRGHSQVWSSTNRQFSIAVLNYQRVYRKYISIAQLHLLTTHLLAGSIPFARHCLPHQKVGLGDSKNCSGWIHRQCHCQVLSSVILFEPWHQQWFLQHDIYLSTAICRYPAYLPNLFIYAGWNLEFQPPPKACGPAPRIAARRFSFGGP